ncbi:IPT/TIG domain-containing protein [Streptomyces sp. FIT100]|nr:IPT/TIG domain-containing protein [Streptomyces sp. FIT100]
MPIDPDQGSTGGGTAVTVTGTNLGGATAVLFGDKQATITGNSATSV